MALVVVLLYRRLRAIKRMAWVLWAGVVFTLGITIVAGFSHFDARQAFSFPAGAFQLNHRFLIGLGAAMLIATYDYWGYYTIAYLAGEVRDPGRTLPRTIIGSIVIIAVLYLLMNISVLGVIPWQEFTSNRPSASHTAMVAELLGRSFGPVWAKVGAWLVIWTAFGSLFSLLLGASRVLWAAAAEATTSVRWHGCTPAEDFRRMCFCCWAPSRAVCCFFDLKAIIAALVALRIVLQFLLQQVGVVLLRRRRPDMPRPFRIWLYPLPVILATLGFLFVLASRAHAGREIVAALVVTFLVWPCTCGEPGAMPHGLSPSRERNRVGSEVVREEVIWNYGCRAYCNRNLPPSHGDSVGRLLALGVHPEVRAAASGEIRSVHVARRPEARCPDLSEANLDWPYSEGLRMDEAMHPLTLLTFGLYGETLPNQDGAPVRIIVPWKYGFKSAKSIVRVHFTDKEPPTTWNMMASNEYGFDSNVNPNVDHPRWSQKTDRRIGASLFKQRQPTLMFRLSCWFLLAGRSSTQEDVSVAWPRSEKQSVGQLLGAAFTTRPETSVPSTSSAWPELVYPVPASSDRRRSISER